MNSHILYCDLLYVFIVEANVSKNILGLIFSNLYNKFLCAGFATVCNVTQT